MKNCELCNKQHFNKKFNKCNTCLGRKKCYSPKCKKQVDKNFRYCFKCNKDFKPKEIEIPKGVCLIDSDDEEAITIIYNNISYSSKAKYSNM
tara:strand:+ start:710 stop:985 length:276 start_codon:yes stop_codon:yes gene_type:complete